MDCELLIIEDKSEIAQSKVQSHDSLIEIKRIGLIMCNHDHDHEDHEVDHRLRNFHKSILLQTTLRKKPLTKARTS